jgi:hypothetical protein
MQIIHIYVETVTTGLVKEIIHVIAEILTTGLVIQIIHVIAKTLTTGLVIQIIPHCRNTEYWASDANNPCLYH